MKNYFNKLNVLMLVFLLLSVLISNGCEKGAEGKVNLDKNDDTENLTQAVEIKVITAEPSELRSVFNTSGTFEPKQKSQLSAKQSGIIEKILVKEGDRVKQGQVLAILSQTDMRIALQQAKVGIKAAEVQVRISGIELNRVKELVAQQAAGSAQLDRIQAQFDGAEAQLELANAQLNKVNQALIDTVLRAPYNGIITTVLKYRGDYVSLMPPSPIFLIVDDNIIKLTIRLPENMLETISIGDIINAKVGNTQRDVNAKVSYINPSVDSITRTFEIIAEIDNTEEPRISTGTSAEVSIMPQKAHNGIAIPQKAILTDEEQEYVYVVEDNIAHRKNIKSISINSEQSEVVNGIKTGELIIIEGLGRIGDGTRIIVEQ